jgi:DNA-binding response OmpR family regulator
MTDQSERPIILIVEDDEDTARLNKRSLNRKGYKVLTAKNAAEASEFASQNSPDLFILDVMLPDGDGVALCEELRADSDAPVLFHTGKRELNDKLAGFNAGGDYYLTKPYTMDEFLAVANSLLRRSEQSRKKINEATTITRGPLTLDIQKSKAAINERDAELTKKEFAILLLLIKNEGKELTSEAIYKNVWNTTMNQDTGTVRQHISRLKKKLKEEETDSFAILNEQGRGYIFTLV